MTNEIKRSLQLEVLLKTIPLFHNLDEATLTSLIETGSEVEFPANHILCRQGDAPDWLYVILMGEVRVYAMADIVDKRLNSTEFAGLRAVNPALKQLFDDVLEATGLIKRHLERAHKLVENFKRISVSQVTDRVEQINLATLVADVVALFSISARAAQLQIRIVNHLPPDGEEWTGYAGYLTQVLLNLLTNIERYAYPGGVGGAVEITLEKDSSFRRDAFAIAVRDHGAGMTPDHLRQVFNPFFTTGRGKGGTGLGMTIVKSLVSELMQGKVQITSTPGEGTTVLILLPNAITVQRST